MSNADPYFEASVGVYQEVAVAPIDFKIFTFEGYFMAPDAFKRFSTAFWGLCPSKTQNILTPPQKKSCRRL